MDFVLLAIRTFYLVVLLSAYVNLFLESGCGVFGGILVPCHFSGSFVDVSLIDSI